MSGLRRACTALNSFISPAHPEYSVTLSLGGRLPPVHHGDLCPLLQVVKGYKATIQQTLDILFLQEGSEFLSSTDASTRDSADRTIIAWDFRTAAKISNQIFHVRSPGLPSACQPWDVPAALGCAPGSFLSGGRGDHLFEVSVARIVIVRSRAAAHGDSLCPFWSSYPWL